MPPLQPHTVRDEIRRTLVLAGPVVLTQLGQVSMGFVDTVMVGRLGADVLAGVALGNSFFFSLTVFCMGILMAVSPMVSQAFGAGQMQALGRTVRQGLWLAMLLAAVVTLILYNAAPILRGLQQDEATLLMTQAYLRAFCWGVLPFLAFIVLRSFIEGVSQPRPVTGIVLMGFLLNIGANYVLMFGKLGFPALGLVGTGWASTLVYWTMMLALLAYIRWQPAFRDWRLFAQFRRPDWAYFREILRIGWPIGLTLGTEISLFAGAVVMMGWVSPEAQAAHQIVIQCAAFTFMVPLGVSIATSVRVGQAVGRGDAPGVGWAGWVGVGLATAFMAVTALAFWLFPRAFVGLFLDLSDPANAPVIEIAVALFVLAALFQVADGVQAAANGSLRGLKDTRVPMWIGSLAYVVLGLPVSYVLGFVLGWGPVGIWWGLVLALTVAAVLLTTRFWRQARAIGNRDGFLPTSPA